MAPCFQQKNKDDVATSMVTDRRARTIYVQLDSLNFCMFTNLLSF